MPSSPPIALVVTAHGRPALAALRVQVAAAKADDPLAPVTVLVPNNFVGLSARRALGGGDHGPIVGDRAGMAGVTFSTLYRLAELHGAADLAASGRRPVSTPIIAAAVRQVLAAAPGYFERVAEHPTTERRLVAAHRELSDLDEPDLQTLAAQSSRAAEVVRIHRAVQGRLTDGWYGEQDLVEAAIAALGSATEAVGPIGDVVVFLPETLSPARSRLVEAVAARTPTTVIAALTGVSDADNAVRRTLGALDLEIPSPPRHPVPENVQITSVSDADDEVRHVVRGIVDAAREGIPFDRMAAVYATENPYLRLLHDHLDAAGIPHNGSAVATLAESAAGRLLRRLLALPDRSYRREDLIGMVSSSPLVWGGGTVPTRAWDQVSRDAGVVKGADDWDRRLQTHIDDARATAEALGEDPEHEARVRRLERDAATARRLQQFVAELAGRLDRGHAIDTWRGRARWAHRLLTAYLGPTTDWPEAEVRALERLRLVLDRLGTLDAVEPGGSLAVFRRSLDLELEGGLGRIGSFGNGVLIGPATVTLGLGLDRVWVLGMSEGTFPSRPRDDSLLPDRERQAVASLRLRADRTGNEHRHFRAALAAVGDTGRADLVFPRGDLRQSNERAPSRWLVELAQERTGDPRLRGSDLAGLRRPWIEETASFTAGLTDTEFPATEQEYELASLVGHLRATGSVADHPLLEAETQLAAGAAAQRARQAAAFTRFDGNLGHLVVAAPGRGRRPTSATALETWARCPHQYFVRYLLGVDPLESPELRLRIDPLSRGTLIHDILDTFVGERIESGTERYGWSEADRRRLHQIADEEFATVEAKGLTGEALYWRRDQVLLRRDLDEFADRDTTRRIDDRLRPLATELGFGLRGARPIELRLDSGPVAIRGSIDVVDETPEGDLVVIDYKTGNKVAITAQDPHKNGTKLQLVLYAVAAREVLERPNARVDSRYWHLKASAKYETTGYEVTPEIERQVLDVVDGILCGIEGGVFPLHPDPTTRSDWIGCHYCDPDGLGVADARRRFVRMSHDPRLAGYVSLAEPKLLDDPTLPLAAPADGSSVGGTR